MESNKYIYLDYAASEPLCEEALAAMESHLKTGEAAVEVGTNPNSLSTPGRRAFKALEQARRDLASAVGAARPDEVIFTSGATEADNAALFGIAHAACEKRRLDLDGAPRPRVVVSTIEHDAVLNAAKHLGRCGFDVVHLPCDRDGFVEVRALEEALTDSTVLVSVQTANSEIGSIQPIRQLAAAAHDAGALFHTDATQALGKIPFDAAGLGIDAASFAAHKIGGPKGIGALYLKSRTPFEPQIFGGGQESGRRSGTQNVCGAAGFAAAAKSAVCQLADEALRMRLLRDKLYRDLARFEQIEPSVEVEEGSLDYLPNIANVHVRGIESETLVLRFDALGFAVSGGSACASGSLDPSHVLTAIGMRADDALGELRVTVGRCTTKEDVEAFIHAVPKVLSWE